MPGGYQQFITYPQPSPQQVPPPVVPQQIPQQTIPVVPDVQIPKTDSLRELRAEFDALRSELGAAKLDKRFSDLRQEMLEADSALLETLGIMQEEIKSIQTNQKTLIQFGQQNRTAIDAMKQQMDKGIGLQLSIDGQLQEPVFKPLGSTFILEREILR